MKTYRIDLSVRQIMDECIDQVSLDFRAVRAAAGQEADRMYDDYTLSADEKEPFAVEFESVAAELCSRHARAVRCCGLSADRLTLDVTVGRPLPQKIVERLLKDYLKARMLAWWYQLRNRDLWQGYVVQAETAWERFHELIGPGCTTRRLRYF